MSELGTAALGAGISGGLGVIGSLVNYGLQKRLAAQQNDYNINMWKMQAEYNSPQAQMQRFKDAGLNPNLIYGQGSNGNMSNAPQQVVPNAPELSESMRKLGEAFNIENLRTVIAKRKEAQADAKNAKVNAERNEAQFEADKEMGGWNFDPISGKFVETPSWYAVNNMAASHFYKQRHFADFYTRTHLIPYRAALLEHQRKYLVPQISMADYESKYYPYSYWIGQGSKITKGLTDIVSLVNPKTWIMPLSRGGSYMAPNGKVFHY